MFSVIDDTIEVTKVRIPTIGAVSPVELDGKFTQVELVKELITHWVPYMNCHRKCYAATTCKFAQLPHHEERCGYRARIIESFTDWVFPMLKESDRSDSERILEAGFHIAEFMHATTFFSGMLVGVSSDKGGDQYKQVMLFEIIKLRDDLNAAGSCVSNLIDDLSATNIIFVEGESEKALLELLQKHISLIPDNTQIQSYGGRGNADPNRIAMLIQSKMKEGYYVRVQGDRDGHATSSLDRLQGSLNLDDSRVFAFTYDLESAYPEDMLNSALSDLDLLNSSQAFEFAYDGSTSVARYLSERFNVDIAGFKVKIAELVGSKLLEFGLAHTRPDEPFFEDNELGRFILFCSRWQN